MEEFTLTSKKKTMSPDMDTELITWSFPLCKIALCTNSATTELGKLTLSMESQKAMIMSEMQTLDTRILSYIISLKPSPPSVGSFVFTKEIKGPTERLLNLSKQEITRDTWPKKPFQMKFYKIIAIVKRLRIDLIQIDSIKAVKRFVAYYFNLLIRFL